MEEQLTEELLKDLLEAPCCEAVAKGAPDFQRTLASYLQELLEEKGLTRSEVLARCEINDTHGWQIFKGKRGAGRDKVLQLAFALGLTLRETNRLLQAAEVHELYSKRRRDAIILYCLTQGYTLQALNEELYRFGEDTLS